MLTERQPNQQCDLCGTIAELRSYGPGGACVCFDCAMKDEEEAKRQFLSRMEGKAPHKADPRTEGGAS